MLCVYSVLASDVVTTPRVSREEDVRWFVERGMLMHTLAVAEHVLSTSTPPRGRGGLGGPSEFELAAVQAEMRAVQRAARGVATATALAKRHNLPPTTTFAMQLAFFSRAAWPPNQRLCRDTQSELLASMESPLFFTSEPSTHRSLHSHAVHPGLVVPLSELSAIAASSSSSSAARPLGKRGGASEAASETDASSVATGSSKFARSECSSSVASSGGRSGRSWCSHGSRSSAGGSEDGDADTLSDCCGWRPLLEMRISDAGGVNGVSV